MSEGHRQLAREFLRMIMQSYPDGYLPGMVFVGIVNENPNVPGGLEIDGSMECGGCFTDEGGKRIVAFSHALRDSFVKISNDVAQASGATCIERDDLEIQVPGERPKA